VHLHRRQFRPAGGAILLPHFGFARVPDGTPQPHMVLTLRLRGGVWLTVRPWD